MTAAAETGFGARTHRIHCAPGFSEAGCRTFLELHRACLAGGAGQILKADPHRHVTLVAGPEGRVCVKEYGWRGRGNRLKDLIRPSPARREWQAAAHLARLEGSPGGAFAPHAFALLEPLLTQRATSAFVILEALENCRGLGDAVAQVAGETRRRRRFVEWFASELARLHALGVHHGDLKASNVLVREAPGEAGWRCFLVDLADVSVRSDVDYTRRATSLAQLNASISRVISTPDRLRFLRRYAADSPGLPPLPELWRHVVRLTRKRRCVWDDDYPGHEVRGPAPSTGS
jgi:hypothetical protein